ncbi:hypothetical protein DFJ74DRAFT_646842 [Hyaloraphidium curvatum]|nr:hypothetical protein DFJ74DRAFT_646842 [Hyaloraphidium curvatum]
MNLACSFFPSSHHFHLLTAFRKIRRFSLACAASGYELTVFIDSAPKERVAAGKFARKTAKSIRIGEKRNPMGMPCLLGDMFRDCGVEVRYALDEEADGTLLASAVAEGAAVLSGDRDFYRFVLDGSQVLPVEIFQNYVFLDDGLELVPSSPPSRMKTPRTLRMPPGRTDPLYSTGFIESLLNTRRYIRGAPTPLLRRIGRNPHLSALPLRQAVYSRILGSASVITEVFPEWDSLSGKVQYRSHDVVPDPSLDALLDRPKEALEHIFRTESLASEKPEDVSELMWENHLYSLHAITFELCSVATGKPMWTIFQENCDLMRFYGENGFLSPM